MTVVLRIFLKLLKSQSLTMIFYTKKIHIYAYVNIKDYIEKYFEMITIFTIFFLPMDYFGLQLQ